MILEFDDYRIDTKELKLTSNGTLVEAEPAVLRVLAYLVENRNKVVTRDQMFSQIWSSRFVSDSALTNHIKNARKVLGDDGGRQRMIKTIHGRGYQFVCPAKEIACYKVAVLPISNLDDSRCSAVDDGFDYLGNALASHLVAELCYFSHLVIYPSYLFMSDKQASNEIILKAKKHKLDFLLVGNYVESEGRTRFFVELIDINNQQMVFSKSLELVGRNIFFLQDTISSVVCEAISTRLKLSLNTGEYKMRELKDNNSKRSSVKKAHLTLL